MLHLVVVAETVAIDPGQRVYEPVNEDLLVVFSVKGFHVNLCVPMVCFVMYISAMCLFVLCCSNNKHTHKHLPSLPSTLSLSLS